jgi:hypothetical protein
MGQSQHGRQPDPPPPLSAKEFKAELELVSTEIEDAIVIHHTAEEINRLAVHDKEIKTALMNNGLFWQTQLHCLQTTLFLTMSRIFDGERDAHTIHSLLNVTLHNTQLFSSDALTGRKMAYGEKPWWLDEYIANAWFPAGPEDLRHLKRALVPFTASFKNIYRPIRNAIFAHRLMSTLEAGVQLFPKTNREEMTDILNFLHDLVECIRELFNNGRNPESGKRDFEEHNQHVHEDVAKVLRRLINGR